MLPCTHTPDAPQASGEANCPKSAAIVWFTFYSAAYLMKIEPSFFLGVSSLCLTSKTCRVWHYNNPLSCLLIWQRTAGTLQCNWERYITFAESQHKLIYFVHHISCHVDPTFFFKAWKWLLSSHEPQINFRQMSQLLATGSRPTLLKPFETRFHLSSCSGMQNFSPTKLILWGRTKGH